MNQLKAFSDLSGAIDSPAAAAAAAPAAPRATPNATGTCSAVCLTCVCMWFCFIDVASRYNKCCYKCRACGYSFCVGGACLLLLLLCPTHHTKCLFCGVFDGRVYVLLLLPLPLLPHTTTSAAGTCFAFKFDVRVYVCDFVILNWMFMCVFTYN